MDRSTQGILLTALSGVLYGTIGYFGHHLMAQGFSVQDLLCWRFLFSALLMLPFVAYQKTTSALPKAKLSSLAFLFVLGGLFYGGSSMFYFEASKFVGTGLAMVLFFTYPIFVVGFSSLIHKSQTSRATWISLALIVLGCLLISISGPVIFDLKGVILGLLSAITYAIYVFWSQGVSRSMPNSLSTFVVCLGTFVFSTLTLLLFQSQLTLPTNSGAWMLMVLFSGIGTILPVMFLLAGMKFISAKKASIISVLEPVTTLFVGIAVLGEPLSLWQTCGVLMIFSSAIIIALDKEHQSDVNEELINPPDIKRVTVSQR